MALFFIFLPHSKVQTLSLVGHEMHEVIVHYHQLFSALFPTKNSVSSTRIVYQFCISHDTNSNHRTYYVCCVNKFMYIGTNVLSSMNACLLIYSYTFIV